MDDSPDVPARWSIPLGAAIALTVCNGPVLGFTFGLFIKPIGQEFGWNRGALSIASGMATLMLATGAPLAGRLIDRWGVCRFVLPAIVLSAVSVALISLTTASLGTFIALYTFAGIASAGHGPQPYVKAIAAWFDRRRGVALGIAMAGVGLGIMLVPQVVRWLIDTYGWRTAYAGLGALVLVVAFPAVALLIREPAASGRLQRGPLHSGNRPRGAGVSLLCELLKSGDFRLLALPAFLVAMSVNGTTVHLVPLLTDRSLPATLATAMLGTVGVASIAGRLLCGYLADRLPAPRVAAAFFLLPCIGLYLLMSRTDRLSVALGAISLGLALGCEVDMMGLLITRYFGLPRLAQIYGYLFAVFAAGAALGKYLMGLSYDVFHSYAPLLVIFMGASLAASGLVSRLGPYVFWAEARGAARV
jgi:MFS family permease